jgi:Protein of unknown function (DUF2442)
MAKHKVLSTDKDIEKALAEAASTTEELIVSEVHLENLGDGMAIIIKMSDGSVHGIPKSKLEGLADATNEAASNFEITEDGLGLRWPDIDLDMFVPALLQGIYGTRAWMSSLGRLGGRARSEAKRTAARLNGLKGGRPRKQVGNGDLEASTSLEQHASRVRRKHSRKDPSRDSSRRPFFPFNRGDYATLFGLDAFATARPLPRIA